MNTESLIPSPGGCSNLKSFRAARLCFLFLACFVAALRADPGRIYTNPDPATAGGIAGATSRPLTHALAVEHDRLHVYRAELADGEKTFLFSHLPAGKYDLVLVAAGNLVFEGLQLGEPPANPDPASLQNLGKRVAVADAFFNRCAVCRIGITGDQALVFVERIRDHLTLQQSGEKLNANLRRLEIIELARASDDWQMTTTRHIYREEMPVAPDPAFLQHFFVPTIGNIRVVDSVKQLGTLKLPAN